MEAPDIYYAAAVMVQQKIYVGKGDTTAIIDGFIQGTRSSAIKDKLLLLQMGRFYNVNLYGDSFKSYPDRFETNKHRVFKLWLNLVKK